MATSKSSDTSSDKSSGGGFLNSPANIVGFILAISVVLLHLTVGLGFLWPVVAIAAWGASVALLPRQSKGAQKSVSSAPKPHPTASPASIHLSCVGIFTGHWAGFSMPSLAKIWQRRK